MDFTDDILKKISLMGSTGKTSAMIALDLNMTPHELLAERKINKKLDDALSLAEYDAEQFMIAKLEADCLNGKNTIISKDIYQRLIQKHNKGNDNKIIIEEV